jgi:lysophospholipase L1-like esterase
VVALAFDSKVESEPSEEIEVTTLAGDPAPIVNFPKSRHQLFLVEGASVALGMSTEGPGWADLVAKHLRGQGSSDLRLINRSIRGSFSYEVADRLKREVDRLSPDLVIIDSAGINDLTPNTGILAVERGFLSLWDFRENVKKMIEAVVPSETRSLVLVNINYFDFRLMEKEGDERLHRKRGAWNKALRDIANEHGLILVDVEKALIDNGGITLMNDPLHPNGRGHAVMAEAIIDAIERYQR